MNDFVRYWYWVRIRVLKRSDDWRTRYYGYATRMYLWLLIISTGLLAVYPWFNQSSIINCVHKFSFLLNEFLQHVLDCLCVVRFPDSTQIQVELVVSPCMKCMSTDEGDLLLDNFPLFWNESFHRLKGLRGWNQILNTRIRPTWSFSNHLYTLLNSSIEII